MADWPDTDELAQVLNVDNVGDWSTTLDRVMAAAIVKVKTDVGAWDEDVDAPVDSLAPAALRRGELLSLRPEAAVGVVSDPTYRRLLKGHRRRFGIA
jgi:hypothetical protein